MNNRKTTKRALWSSVVSLLLCFAMLMGTTYAWFTDSVTSANNIIKSGNLDIELEYLKNGEWVDVKDASDILTNELWEPGVTEVAYFRIANAGSLALKYQFGINIVSETAGKNVAGETFKLSDYIQFGVVEGVNGKTDAYDNREAAVAAVTDAKKISAGFTKAAAMEHDTEIYLALVVYMPTTVGNEANHNGTDVPQIDLGINIFATQAESEEDGFGTDYDADAWMPEMQVYTAEDLQAAVANAEPGTEIVLQNDIVLDEPIVIPAPETATYSMRSTPAAVVLDLNGKTLTGTMHKNDGAVIKNEGNLILKNGTVSSTANNGGSAVVNKGNLVAENVILNGAPNADGSWPSYTVNNTGIMTADNAKITSYHGAVASYGEGAVVTLNNCEIDMAGIPGFTSHGIYTYNNGAVIVNGGVYANKAADQNSTGASVINGAVTVNGGTFSGRIENYYGTPVIKGGIFSVNPNAKFVAEGFAAVKHDDGNYYVVSDNASEADLYISNVEQLKAFAEMVNTSNRTTYSGTVVLLADIDLNGEVWNGIGVDTWNSFNGTFDGQGHTISNFVLATSSGNYGAGFFANVLGGVVIKNVNFDSVSYAKRSNVVGVVAAYLYGSGTFENINVTNVDVQSFGKVGGILGMAADPGAHTITMTNCSVEGVIGGGYNVGGLIGLVLQGQTVNLTNCETDVVFCMNDGGYNMNYVKTERGWMWNYNDQWLYAGVAEDYCYYDVEENEYCHTAPAEMYLVASDIAQLQAVVESTGGTVNVVLTKDINGDITINQDLKTNLVIDGNGHTYNGTITIKAQSDTTAAASITFKNINFKTADAERTFISSSETNHYPLNVTVSGCTFEGAGANSNVVGISVKSAKNLVIENCTATKMHSILQNNSGWNLIIRDVTVTESGRGVALGTVQGVTVTNLTVEAAKYGIRLDAGYNNNAVITDCDITAFIPVVVRKVSVDSAVTFNGTNTMTETNTDGIWCAIGTSEYETNGTMPSAAAKTVTVTLNDTGLDANGLYNNSGK